MPVKIEEIAKPSFFGSAKSHIASSVKNARSASFIDVGGHGDCEFRSLTVGIIDNFISYPRKQNTELLSKLLGAYYQYFPQYRSNMPGLVTPVDRMQQLINRMPMAMLVQTMGYVLRQMAVTELCSNPWRYRGAFVEKNENTSPTEMRRQGTWIDESAIAAIAHVLSMPIKIQEVDRLKTLPLCRHYPPTDASSMSPIVLEHQGNRYQVKTMSTERFQAVGNQSIPSIQPVEDLPVRDPSMPELLAKIAAEDHRMMKVFEDRSNQLSLMVEAQELNLEKLLAIYVKGMSQSDYLSGTVACPLAEHGNQTLFDTILRDQQGVSDTGKATKTHDQSIVDELIHAIARALSIGQMNENKVFAEIEATQSVTSTHLSR